MRVSPKTTIHHLVGCSCRNSIGIYSVCWCGLACAHHHTDDDNQHQCQCYEEGVHHRQRPALICHQKPYLRNVSRAMGTIGCSTLPPHPHQLLATYSLSHILQHLSKRIDVGAGTAYSIWLQLLGGYIATCACRNLKHAERLAVR